MCESLKMSNHINLLDSLGSRRSTSPVSLIWCSATSSNKLCSFPKCINSLCGVPKFTESFNQWNSG